jgi:hypothetical protein
MTRKSEDLPGKCETVGVEYSVEEMFNQLNLPGYFAGYKKFIISNAAVL